MEIDNILENIEKRLKQDGISVDTSKDQSNVTSVKEESSGSFSTAEQVARLFNYAPKQHTKKRKDPQASRPKTGSYVSTARSSKNISYPIVGKCYPIVGLSHPFEHRHNLKDILNSGSGLVSKVVDSVKDRMHGLESKYEGLLHKKDVENGFKTGGSVEDFDAQERMSEESAVGDAKPVLRLARNEDACPLCKKVITVSFGFIRDFWKQGLMMLVPLIALVLVLSLMPSHAVTGMAVFSDGSKIDFNNGTHKDTVYNSTLGAVMLALPKVSGEYDSKVFDSGAGASWDNMSWSSNTGSVFVGLDVEEHVWKSIDGGLTWFPTTYTFSGKDKNGLGMIHTSDGSLFIVDSKNIVYRSTDYGHRWRSINSDYNGQESQSPVLMASDKNDFLYIIEGDEDVWRSWDLGTTWVKVRDDFDQSEKIGNAVGSAVNMVGSLFLVTRDASVYRTDDNGYNWTLVNSDYNGQDADRASSMAIIGNTLFILDDQAVWRSSDGGQSWKKVNEDFNNVTDADGGRVLTSDFKGNLYALDSGESLFISRDYGHNWAIMNDNINGGNGNFIALLSYVEPPLRLQVRSSNNPDAWSDFVGPDGSTRTYYTGSFADLNVPSLRYFQYKAYFESSDIDYSPLLENLTVHFSPPPSDVPPFVRLDSPEDGFKSEVSSMTLTCSATDDVKVSRLELYTNLTGWSLYRSTDGIAFSTTIDSIRQGTYSWSCLAYDNFNQKAWGPNRTFTILPPADINISGNCTPDWSCKDWSQCFIDTQSRTCEDLNGCTEDLKIETLPCVVPGIVANKTSDLDVLIPREETHGGSEESLEKVESETSEESVSPGQPETAPEKMKPSAGSPLMTTSFSTLLVILVIAALAGILTSVAVRSNVPDMLRGGKKSGPSDYTWGEDTELVEKKEKVKKKIEKRKREERPVEEHELEEEKPEEGKLEESEKPELPARKSWFSFKRPKHKPAPRPAVVQESVYEDKEVTYEKPKAVYKGSSYEAETGTADIERRVEEERVEEKPEDVLFSPTRSSRLRSFHQSEDEFIAERKRLRKSIAKRETPEELYRFEPVDKEPEVVEECSVPVKPKVARVKEVSRGKKVEDIDFGEYPDLENVKEMLEEEIIEKEQELEDVKTLEQKIEHEHELLLKKKGKFKLFMQRIRILDNKIKRDRKRLEKEQKERMKKLKELKNILSMEE